MAGINRLGRGTAKPGTLRPTDPNRFKTEDFFSVDAEQDPEYIRRVIEVEQLAARGQGCVLARGEKARNKELELRDAELGKFTRIRYESEDQAGIGDTASPARKRPMHVKRQAVIKKLTASSAGAESRPPEASVAAVPPAAPVSPPVQTGAAPSQQAGSTAPHQAGRAAATLQAQQQSGQQQGMAVASLGLGYLSSSGSESDADEQDTDDTDEGDAGGG